VTDVHVWRNTPVWRIDAVQIVLHHFGCMHVTSRSFVLICRTVAVLHMGSIFTRPQNRNRTERKTTRFMCVIDVCHLRDVQNRCLYNKVLFNVFVRIKKDTKSVDVASSSPSCLISYFHHHLSSRKMKMKIDPTMTTM
jgi:hypothetical protein